MEILVAINIFRHDYLLGAWTNHATPEFPWNRHQCRHSSNPAHPLFSRQIFNQNHACRAFLTRRINGLHQLITQYGPERARLRVFLRQNHRPNLRNEIAPELHGILVINRRIDVFEWEQEVVGPLVDQLLQRGAEEGLFRRYVITGLHLDVLI